MFEVGFGTLPDRLDAIGVDYGLQAEQILFCEQSQGDALPAHSCSPASAVGIGISIAGEIVIDDVTRVGKVQSAAGEGRGDHDLDFEFTKTIEKRCSSGLIESSVNDFCGGKLLF